MPPTIRRWTVAVGLIGFAPVLALPACHTGAATPPTPPELAVVYRNDFTGPVGSSFPEWTSAPITFHKTVTGQTGTLPAGAVVTVESPNRRQRFLGEFGGPPVGRPGDPDWNRTRVEQTIRLTLQG